MAVGAVSKKRILMASREPNLEGLSDVQRAHVLRVFPETRTSMAEYLRRGVEVYIYRQDEASPDVPPVAIALIQDPSYWIDCVNSESVAVDLAVSLGLNVVKPPDDVTVR